MAKRFFITKDLDVFQFESQNEWGSVRHKHNFFELTFIIKGNGKHILNENKMAYKTGDVFLLTPEDEHEFIVENPTKFGIIKFTEQLFLEKANTISSMHWRKNLDTVIFYANIIPESIVACEIDRKQLFSLFELIRSEYSRNDIYSRNVLLELFGALLIIVSRNLKSSLKNITKIVISEKEKINNILSYIRQNVLDKECLKIKNIAQEFNFSPNYISVFVKKHSGISIQNYVIQTKIKMAERLLRQTNLTISEISHKLNFTDSSHFNKIFKKYTGKNPSEFV